MLKKRIVAVLTIKNEIVVQSIGFKRYLPVGDIGVCVEFLNQWGIDEIVLLDMEAGAEKRKPNCDLIREVSRKCFVPLTVGGGIRDLDDIKNLIYNGADKISINKAALDSPELIRGASAVFGNQCVVVSLDVKRSDKGYEVFSESGKIPTGRNPVDSAVMAEEAGAGEIFLNSIDRDGAKIGYDLDLIKAVADAVSIPVIACGGAGHPEHFKELFAACGVSAAAAGNFFHFTEHSPIVLKSFLKKRGFDIRLDTYADYKDFEYGEDGRIVKMPDEYLERLRFKYQPKEII